MHTHRQALLAPLSALALMIPLAVIDAAHQPAVAQAAATVSIDGGSAEHRRTVLDAIDRFERSGLNMPDLQITIHQDRSGCDGKQGLFRRSGQVGVIDLCYQGEFLVLHELGHAWERFNLDDADRDDFMQSTGAPAWRSADIVWRSRGAERAANAIANGLLSVPLETAEYHTGWFAEFEALTGVVSPRLAELQPSRTPIAPPAAEQASRMSAYEAWRATAG
jgi:hypothetical protein